MTIPGDKQTSARPYWLALDGLRGLAVLLVLGDHSGLIAKGHPAGAVGVTIFFVLSGFLITNVISVARDRGTWSFRNFFGNRLARLFPALILMELVIGTWWLLDGRPWQLLLEYVASATLYLEDFLHGRHNQTLLSHTWSLAVEEQFYLIWPFLVPVMMRSKRSIVWMVGVLVAVSIGSRLVLAAAGMANFAYANIVTNAYALLIGCAIALLSLRIRQRQYRVILGAAAGLVLIFCAVGPVVPQGYIILPILAAFAAGILVLSILDGSDVFEWAPLRFVGRISYSLYLWHWPLLLMSGSLFGGGAALPMIALSFVIATASTLLVEEPIRRAWRRRNRSRTTHAAVTATT
ncbi:acyltransferase [Cryobacterium sp. TMT4-31]|uniref:acyltransferase family protein n=1 Tax=Cryobacterium sp. TMT4-31 TaxID=1259259 RepID=UPI00141A8F6B|nr:acyltransferase [Cryobacterium sp. TMT4-31]